MKALDACADRGEGLGGPGRPGMQLLEQVQAHDRVAFREVVHQLQNRIFSVSYALLGDASEADLAAQKVFVRLYRTVGHVSPQHDLIKYAYRLAIDQCLVELRTRRLRQLFGWLTGSTSTRDSKRLPRTYEISERILVVRVLSMLRHKERALLVLKEVADQTVAEIADIMQLSPAVVRRRLFAARQKFSWAATELSRLDNLRCI